MTDQAHLRGYSAIKTITLMFWLACLGAAKIYYGVDMGSQFVKVGRYDSVTNEITKVELDGSDLIPAALALKVKASKEEHITPSDFPNSQILLGSQAVKAIHKDPKVGVEFLPLAAARVDDEFLTSKLLNGLEFMALFERHPEFDDLDDSFVEMEEEVTATLARYIDEHISEFAVITNTKA